jgi:very-short-patch-repair endonuclease
MRHAPSAPEQVLWAVLRKRQLGASFRRQVVLLGRYIVDFYAAKERLIVEVDGQLFHAQRAQADKGRDAALRRAGFSVLRLDAQLVLQELPVAVARVQERLRELQQG